MVKRMMMILKVLNDFVANLDPISVLFGGFICIFNGFCFFLIDYLEDKYIWSKKGDKDDV